VGRASQVQDRFWNLGASQLQARVPGPRDPANALAKSINTVSAQIVAQIGVDAVIDVMRRLGITSKLPQSLSLALGTPDLTLQEVAYGLAAFPAGGKLVTPLFIVKIVDADGRVLEDYTAPQPREDRLSPETAYVVTDLMKGVVEIGTGKKARELGRPAAGKTGTSLTIATPGSSASCPSCFAAFGSAATTSSPSATTQRAARWPCHLAYVHAGGPALDPGTRL